MSGSDRDFLFGILWGIPVGVILTLLVSVLFGAH